MRIAIVHYHLGAGGVSHVIAAASRALTDAGVAHGILVGAAADDLAADLPVKILPGLGYGGTIGVGELRAAAAEMLGAAPDIWHFHNHSLGKNRSLVEAVARLAEEHERLVLQIHDLAEDGRPKNYPVIADFAGLYPVAERVRYVFLNERDLKVFAGAGLVGGSVLGNVVEAGSVGAGKELESPIVFAPVRGIRRKNLGELVFLSAIAPAECRFAVSRAPRDAEALAIHDRWSRFAKRQGLAIAFDVVDRFEPVAGAGPGFEAWVEHATHIASTSVAEGFGLPFLEAAAWGKPLIGRNLTYITEEHRRHGIDAGDLYDRLMVPVEWVNLPILRDHLNTTLERNYRAYGRPLSGDLLADTFDALLGGGWLDFGNLPEPLQQGVIERLKDPASRRVPLVRKGGEAVAAEDWLRRAIRNRTPSVSTDQLAPYSREQYRRSLLAVYEPLCGKEAGAVGFLPKSAILSAFLRPASFHFLLSAIKPDVSPLKLHRAVIFDIYGTLLIAPAGGVKTDPAADSLLRAVLTSFGHDAPDSPSAELHAAVLRHHAASGREFPEVDLRVLWREVLGLEDSVDVSPMVEAIEAAWHPARLMPGAERIIQQLARAGVSLGVLSNAQFTTLASLGGVADLLAPELTILSYQHGIAKPSPELFEMMVDRLAGRGISPDEVLFIGNDPLQDIVPAAAHGFKTALFIGHPESARPGECQPDFLITRWSDLAELGSSKMHG